MMKRVLKYVFLLFILVLLMPLFISFSLKSNIYCDVNKVETKEFAIVLGAGLKRNGAPGYYLKNRLNTCIDLYKKKKIQKVLVSGDNSVKSHDEISAMYNYLVKNGVPKNIIFGDYAGFDTYSTMYRAKEIFTVKEAIIVSQEYHLPRSLFIAKSKGMNVAGISDCSFKVRKKYKIREWVATIKSVFDVIRQRKPKFLGDRINIEQGSNIK